MPSNYYDTLGISKTASSDEIKKAYRKMAMKYHPDRNKGNKQSEDKIKEINEAYGTLSDAKKRKNYDTFGNSSSNPFSGKTHTSSDFGDIFSGFGNTRNSKSGNFNINIEDLFQGFSGTSGSSNHFGGYQNEHTETTKKEENLDFEKTYEVPIFDLILGCSIEVSGVYGKKAKLKIPAGTTSGSKFRVKGFGKSDNNKKGNLIVLIKSLMPKHISDTDKSMLERIRENVGY